MTSQEPNLPPEGQPQAPLDPDPIRPHVFDGDIREYDKLMPNWWLFTFWTAVAFAFGYWIYAHEWGFLRDPGVALHEEMAENTRLASIRSGVLDDQVLWQMSQDAKLVDAGKMTFVSTCAACHMPDLKGGIGPNLVDTAWIHGGQPLEIMKTITDGVLAKGMPTWGPILGKQKITEVTAFILSHHRQGEPVQKVDGWVPGAPSVTQANPPARGL